MLFCGGTTDTVLLVRPRDALMKSWPKTIGCGGILITATTMMRVWCRLVHLHFAYVHPGGVGTVYANFFWHYSWLGIAVGSLLFTALVASHVKGSSTLYDVIYHGSLWLLVAWFGAASMAMETCFFLYWTDPHGEHW
jgi:hypothetical protein